uniref:Uncharacterized protein n=1 Tax=Anopheles farauti TaxID=69004 RepID=A0A182PZV2_9DIPT
MVPAPAVSSDASELLEPPDGLRAGRTAAVMDDRSPPLPPPPPPADPERFVVELAKNDTQLTVGREHNLDERFVHDVGGGRHHLQHVVRVVVVAEQQQPLRQPVQPILRDLYASSLSVLSVSALDSTVVMSRRFPNWKINVISSPAIFTLVSSGSVLSEWKREEEGRDGEGHGTGQQLLS